MRQWTGLTTTKKRSPKMSKKEFYEMILEDIADAYWQEYDRGDWMQELESELSMYDLDQYYEEACTTVAERM
jgi:hypothetical protein